MTALQPTLSASGPNSTSPTAKPNGQLAIEIAIAVTISRPTNQSAIILAPRTLMNTAPMPATSRPAATTANDDASPIRTPPAAIRASPASMICLAPKRWPSMPLGSAITTPGSR